MNSLSCEVLGPNDGWDHDIDGQGNFIYPGKVPQAYSAETGQPATQEIDALGNPAGTNYDHNGNPIPNH